MAQIVGAKSNIFRCNLQAIQTGGTKAGIILAADEVWLIDTTNSLTDSLSGECDAYIMGDGNTAAKALSIRPFGVNEAKIYGIDLMTSGGVFNELQKVTGRKANYKEGVYIDGGGAEVGGSYGVASSSSYYEPITLQDGDTLKLDAVNTVNKYIVFFDENFTKVGFFAANSRGREITVGSSHTWASSVAYFRFSFETATRNEAYVKKNGLLIYEARDAIEAGFASKELNPVVGFYENNSVDFLEKTDGYTNLVTYPVNTFETGYKTIKINSCSNADAWLKIIYRDENDVYDEINLTAPLTGKSVTINAIKTYPIYLRMYNMTSAGTLDYSLYYGGLMADVATLNGRMTGAESNIEDLDNSVTILQSAIDTSRLLKFIGNNNAFSNGEKITGKFEAGKQYQFMPVTPNVDMSGVTVTSAYRFSLYSYNSSNVQTTLHQIAITNDLTPFVIQIPEDSVAISIGGRCTLGAICAYNAEPVENGYGIFKFNPTEQFDDRFINAKKLKNGGTHTPIVLAHFSDIHGKADNFMRLLGYCQYYEDYIDDIINTGDTIINSFENDWTWFDKVIGHEKVINVIGNHDTASYSNGTYNWTAYAGADAYARYIGPFISNWGVVHDGNTSHCYFYKDYASQKVRFIFLDVMGYDTTENTWFANTLEDARTNSLSVVVVAHYWGAGGAEVKCNYACLKTNSLTTSVLNYNANIADAVPAVATFINNGGELICWLVGHQHRDIINIVDANQLVIAVDTAQYGSNSQNDECIKTIDTKSQDSFNIVSINVDYKTITLFRVGCNTDMFQREKQGICIDYNTRQVLAES